MGLLNNIHEGSGGY